MKKPQDIKASDSMPLLSPLSDFGDLIPLKEWLSAVNDGNFIDYDGHGQWATTDGMGEYVKPSDIIKNRQAPPSWATHVMWYNR